MTIVSFLIRFCNTLLQKLRLLVFVFILLSTTTDAQIFLEEENVLAKANFTNIIPKELISTRSVVLYQNNFTKKELEETQTFFQQTGIDAVAYFDVGRVFAGHDTRKPYATNFSARGIKHLIFIQKNEKGYQFIFCPFSGSKEFVDNKNPSWKQQDVSLTELLKTIYRFAVSNLKKQNFLINALPETELGIKIFKGRVEEKFSYDVKTFKTAIPRFGNGQDDAELEAYLKENFPVKYELVEPDPDEVALANKGFRSILRFVHARGVVAKELLGYDISQIARSLPSAVVFNNEVQIKTIPANQSVYKFYFRNLEYGDIFLGTKWDADITWQEALRNHLQAMNLDQKAK